jgi:phospholipid/cholesterol/gamma-HCH transport system substrate-binding protein
MYNHAYALVTGVFLVVLTAGALVATYWLAGVDTERQPYVVVTEGAVTGLGEGSQVYFRGVRAGRVEHIAIDPADPREIRIWIGVSQHIPITRSTFATLQLSGLTGLTQIELDDTYEDPSPLPTAPTEPGEIPMRPGLLDRMAAAGPELIANVNELILRLNELFDEENQQRITTILTNADRLLGTMDRLTAQLETEIGRTGAAVSRSVDTLGEFVGEASGSLARVDGVLEELRKLAVSGRRLAEEMGEQALPGIESLFSELEATGRELGRLARELRRRPEGALYGRPRPPPGPGEEEEDSR